MKLYYNNKTTINISNNLVIHNRTKHVEINRYFIREKIDFKELTLRYIKIPMDMFTNGLSSSNISKYM